jgi:hypothetical protein
MPTAAVSMLKHDPSGMGFMANVPGAANSFDEIIALKRKPSRKTAKQARNTQGTSEVFALFLRCVW